MIDMKYFLGFVLSLMSLDIFGQSINVKIDKFIIKCSESNYIVPKEIPFETVEWRDISAYNYWRDEDYFFESHFYFQKFEQLLYKELFKNKHKMLLDFKTKLKSDQHINGIFVYDLMFFLQEVKKGDYFELLELLLDRVEKNKLHEEILMASIEQNYFGNYYSCLILKNMHLESVNSILIRTIKSSKISRANKELLSKYFDKEWVKSQLNTRKIKKIKLNDAQFDF
jgi:hypothetical protein